MQVTLPYQVVLLVRTESHKTPLIVQAHEIEVLKALHGADNIEITDAEPPVAEGTFEVADEYERLKQAYRGNNDIPDPVREGVGTLADFEASFEGYEAKPKAVAKPKGGKGKKAEDGNNVGGGDGATS